MGKKSFIISIIIFMMLVPSVAEAATVNVYRFYNKNTGTHFYTASPQEKEDVQSRYSKVFNYEGVSYAFDDGSLLLTQSLYRFYNTQTDTHFYTASDTERDMVISKWGNVFKYEGVAYKVATTQEQEQHLFTDFITMTLIPIFIRYRKRRRILCLVDMTMSFNMKE